MTISNEYLFTPEVMAVSLTEKFKMPSVKSYGGNKYPLEHLEDLKGLMDIYTYSDAIRY